MSQPVDLLIVGQGIAGTLLGWHAEKSGLSFKIMDQGALTSASAVSSGIINPITGPKFVKSWMVDELRTYAIQCYQEIGKALDTPVVRHIPLWRNIKNVQAENLWMSRLLDPHYSQFMQEPLAAKEEKQLFSSADRFAVVSASLQVLCERLIQLSRIRWNTRNQLIEETFDTESLELGNEGFKYNSITYHNVIMACGFKFQNPFFQMEDYRPVKGEVLVCDIPGMPDDRMFKIGKFIVPLPGGQFWVGSNYQHDFENSHPDRHALEPLLEFLSSELKLEYTEINHLSGIRPATRYRRPFIGAHPEIINLYLFNGLGTKGMSLAPYFARKVIRAIATGQKLEPTQAFVKAFH